MALSLTSTYISSDTAVGSGGIKLENIMDFAYLAQTVSMSTHRTTFLYSKVTGDSFSIPAGKDRIKVLIAGHYWFDFRQRVTDGGAGQLSLNNAATLYDDDPTVIGSDHMHNTLNAPGVARALGYFSANDEISAYASNGMYSSVGGAAYLGTFYAFRLG
jgi:hypothetical protein